jgi:hypothetical protein
MRVWHFISATSQMNVDTHANTKHTRFCNNPAARALGVRFYAGAPLVSSAGHRLGTLCFADAKPRVFDDASMQVCVCVRACVRVGGGGAVSGCRSGLAAAAVGRAIHAADVDATVAPLLACPPLATPCSCSATSASW